jgi:hypothetical protein
LRGHHANYCPKDALIAEFEQSKRHRKKRKAIELDSDSDSSASSSSSSSDEGKSRQRSSKKKRHIAKREKKEVDAFARKNPGCLQRLIEREKMEKKESKARETVTMLSKVWSEQFGIPVPPVVTPNPTANLPPDSNSTGVTPGAQSDTQRNIEQVVSDSIAKAFSEKIGSPTPPPPPIGWTRQEACSHG